MVGLERGTDVNAFSTGTFYDEDQKMDRGGGKGKATLRILKGGKKKCARGHIVSVRIGKNPG